MAGRCGCQRTCSCCTVGTDTISVGGSGSAGACFRPEAKIAPVAGNVLVSDPDGLGLLVLLCAVDPSGDPVPTDPVTGCLLLPPPVILDYEGNPIAPGEDGSIQLPTGGLPPAYACGLETDGEGVLSVKTSGTWPGDDLLGVGFEGDYTEGSEIYCGPDGALRGVPQGTAITAGAAEQVLAPTLESVAGTFNSAAGAAVLLTNPSLARSMLALRVMTATVDVVVPPDGAIELRLQERVDGGGWTTVRSFGPAEPDSGTANLRSKPTVTWARTSTVPPGGGHTLELRVQAEKTGLGGSDPILVEIDVAARLMGVSQ